MAPVPDADGPHASLLDQVIRLLRNRWWVFLASLLILPALTAFLTSREEERYDATATLLFRDVDRELLNGDTGFRDPNRVAATNEALIELPAVAAQAARNLDGRVTAAEVAEAISVDGPGDADVLEVVARTTSRSLSPQIANAYASAYIAFRQDANASEVRAARETVRRNFEALSAEERASVEGRRLQRRLNELDLAASLQTGGAVIVQPAGAPREPSSPSLRRNLAMSILLALVLAFALAYLIERLDTRVRRLEELETLFGSSVIARIPRSRRLHPHGAGVDLEVAGAEAEAFRTLRANLRFFHVDGELRSLLVTSPISGDGKSTIARGLAMVMASMGDRVVLVETDLHKPGIRGRRREQTSLGLSTVLAGGSIDEALVEMPIGIADDVDGDRRLTVLPAGPLPPNPSELLESRRMSDVLAELEERFDLVLLDSPPLSVVSDALVLVPQVAGVLVVSGLGHTTRSSAQELRRQLALLGRRPLGLVANFAQVEQGGYYYQHARAIRAS